MTLRMAFPGVMVTVGILFAAGCKRESPSQAAAVSNAPLPTVVQARSLPGASPLFTQVIPQLDPGGNAFVYLSAEQWLHGLSTNLALLEPLLVSLAAQGTGRTQTVAAAVTVLRQLAAESGIEELAAVGFSSAPVASNLFRAKLILQHYAEAGSGFLWSALGGQAHEISWPGMLPTNTAFAAFTDFDLRMLWEHLERVLMDSESPLAQRAAVRWPIVFKRITDVSWSSFLDSLAGEAGVAVVLDPKRHLQLPSAPAPLPIPQPQLLLALRVHNDVLYDRLADWIRQAPQHTTNQAPGWRWCTLPMPVAQGTAIELTVARSGDYLFVTTSEALLAQVRSILARQTPGLNDHPPYHRWQTYLPPRANAWAYASPAWTTLISSQRRTSLQQILANLPSAQQTTLARWLEPSPPRQIIAAAAHQPDGWQIVAVSERDPTDVFLTVPVAVTAFTAGVTLPVLAKARERTAAIRTLQRAKQLALAARLYAIDHGDHLPPADRWCDELVHYLPSPDLLKGGPDNARTQCAFALNAAIAGHNVNQLPPDTVLFFEAQNGWNQAGGPELLSSSPPIQSRCAVAFVDGSARFVSRNRLQALRWTP